MGGAPVWDGGRLPELMLHNGVMKVRPLDEGDCSWLSRLVTQEWGIPVVSVSGVHNPSNLPGFVAVDGDRRVGVVTYRITDEECEVVTLNSLEEDKGVGTALLGAVKAIADQNAARLWLITTDDNGKAIRFYENRGMTRAVLHRNFIDVVRVHKPHVNRGAGATCYCHAMNSGFEPSLFLCWNGDEHDASIPAGPVSAGITARLVPGQ